MADPSGALYRSRRSGGYRSHSDGRMETGERAGGYYAGAGGRWVPSSTGANVGDTTRMITGAANPNGLAALLFVFGKVIRIKSLMQLR